MNCKSVNPTDANTVWDTSYVGDKHRSPTTYYKINNMPTAPLNTECKEYQCRNPKTNRSAYCVEHGGGTTDKGKANSKLYGQKAWANIRARQLSKQPLCARCQSENRITAANVVDHVFPHRRDADAFKVNLFQSLCTACHTLKTQDENKGRYLHYTAHGVVEYTGDDYIRICGRMGW